MILLTGITGFLGSKIARELLLDGKEVCGICRSTSSYKRVEDIYDQIKWVNNSREEINKAFEEYNIDIIIHCATDYGRDAESFVRVMQSNYVFPLNLIDAGRKNNIRMFINTDTFFTDEMKDGWKKGETVYLNSYVKSKFSFRETIRENIDSMHFAFVNLKLHHIYGDDDGEGKFVSFLIDALKKNVEEIELSQGAQGRDWINVRDVVSAYSFIVNHEDEFNDGYFYDFEVGTGIETSVRDFCILAKEISCSSTKLLFGKREMNKNELMHAKADISALKELGWTPQVSLEDGVRRMFDL